MKHTLIAAILVTTTGCSFVVALGGNTSFRPPQEPDCIRFSYAAAAALDTFVAGWAYKASLESDACMVPDNRRECLNAEEFENGVQKFFAVAYALGAVAGYAFTARCVYSHHKYKKWREAESEETDRARKWRMDTCHALKTAYSVETDAEERYRICNRLRSACDESGQRRVCDRPSR